MRTSFFDGIFASDNLPLNSTELTVLGDQWKWILASGGAFLLLGAMALALPAQSTVSLNYSFGSLFLVAGLVLFAQSHEFRHQRGSGLRLFQSLLALTMCILMFQYPQSGMIGITLVLSFYFLASAALKWAFFSVVRIHSGWNWGLLSAIISFLLYLITIFPFSSFWVPRTLLALEFALSGIGMIGIALSVQKFQSRGLLDEVRSDIHEDQGLFPSRRSPFAFRR